MKFTQWLNSLSAIRAFLFGLAGMLVIGGLFALFSYSTNTQRGFGVITFVVMGMAALGLSLEGERRTAGVLGLIWAAGIIAGPGLIRAADILSRPVYRGMEIAKIPAGTNGIIYLHNARLAGDRTFSTRINHWSRSTTRRQTVRSYDTYQTAPILDKNWKDKDPVQLWATYINEDKILPSRMKYALDWKNEKSYNAAVLFDLEADMRKELIRIAEKKHDLLSTPNARIAYIADDPVETATRRCYLYGGIMLALLAGYAVLCGMKPAPGAAASEA